MAKKKSSVDPVSFLGDSAEGDFGEYFDSSPVPSLGVPQEEPSGGPSLVASPGGVTASPAKGSPRVGRAPGGGRKGDPTGALVTVKLPVGVKTRLDVAKTALKVSDGKTYSFGELIGILLERGLKGLSRTAWEKYRTVMDALYGPEG